ncbi:ATP phosphoribosyltransferase [Candidatus Vidania fulgoroideorum]
MIIAVPKGRIYERFRRFLIMHNIYLYERDRTYMVYTSIKNMKIALVKSIDSYYLVNQGKADIGILGSDILSEYMIFSKPIHFRTLWFFQCGMFFIRKRVLRKSRRFTIATKYKNTVERHLINARVYKMRGSCEIINDLNIADYAVDIVETGKTLQANNLLGLNKIMDIRPVVFGKHRDLIDKFYRNIFA